MGAEVIRHLFGTFLALFSLFSIFTFMKYVVVVDTDKMSTVWREAFDTIFAGESHSITSLVSGSTYKTAKRYKNFLT